MPIIECPNENDPLSQGDILAGIHLFCSGQPEGGNGGAAIRAETKYCIVLSRRCYLEHHTSAIVASVAKYPVEPPKDAKTLDDVLLFLTGTRDGYRTPDLFYLGQLPDKTGRYCCHFDQLFTIQLPPTGEQRDVFVRQYRIGVLSNDFIRDLHVRLFRAVASLGFDDYGWLSDEDLKWVVATGQFDLDKAQEKLSDAERVQAGATASGKPIKTDIEEKATARARVEAELRPYQDELKRRGVGGE